MIVPSLQSFGGLENIATQTAAALQQDGQIVCVVSPGWAPPDNYYRVFLRGHGIPFFQAPRWLYQAAADWQTKERMLGWILRIAWPLTLAAAAALKIGGRRATWRAAWSSAQGWLGRHVLENLIGPDRRQALGRMLLTWWCWRWRPNLLHLQGYTTSLIFALDWAATRRLPVVYTENSTPDPRVDRWAEFGPRLNQATIVIAASEPSAQALRDVCKIVRPLETFIPPVNDPVADGHGCMDPSEAPDGALRVTTVARLSEPKGLTFMLEAYARVRNEYPHVQFRVYGDGPLRTELLADATRLGLNGEEIFVGPFAPALLPQIMRRTDVFLMTSVLEGLPLSLVEAMAYGRAIIATAVGGNTDLITHGLNGLLCRPRDVECLSERLRCLLSDADLRARLGRAARQAYEAGAFAPSAVARHHRAIYARALANYTADASPD